MSPLDMEMMMSLGGDGGNKYQRMHQRPNFMQARGGPGHMMMRGGGLGMDDRNAFGKRPRAQDDAVIQVTSSNEPDSKDG